MSTSLGGLNGLDLGQMDSGLTGPVNRVVSLSSFPVFTKADITMQLGGSKPLGVIIPSSGRSR